MKITDFPIKDISKLAEKESWRKEVNRPIYHLHKWWAQRLGSVFRGILIHLLSAPSQNTWELFYENNHFDKIVFDPFMGSGTTLGEGLKLGARVVGCDINPISSFLVKQELTKVSLNEIEKQMKLLDENIAPQIREFYSTVDPITNASIPALYYFWVKIVVTPDGEKIPLFSRYVFAQDAYPSKKPMAQLVCPKCGGIFTDRYDSIKSICPDCMENFNPQTGPVKGAYVYDHFGKKYKIKSLLPQNGLLEEKLFAILALRNNNEKMYLRATEYDIALYEKAVTQLEKEDLPIPQMSVRSGHNTDQARGYNYLFWSDFFNKRQQLCLGLLLKEILRISDERIREQFLCLFSSTLEYNNMFCSYKGEGTGAVRPIFSNHILKPERTPLENSVWGTAKSSGCFSTLYKTRFLTAKKYLEYPFELKIMDNGQCCKVNPNDPFNPNLVQSWDELIAVDGSALVLCGDSANTTIPSNSVDMVVTDPPYFDYIHYSELSDFFYAWLSPVLKSKYIEFTPDSSGRENEVQHISADEFSKMLGRVFMECHRVMKHDAKLCFSFHHARPEGWVAIAKALINAGFFLEEAFPVHAELMASTPKAAAKEPISLDTILVCSKTQQFDGDKQGVVNEYISMLRAENKKLSCSDIFVIYAAQTLVRCINRRLPEEEMFQLLENDLINSLQYDVAKTVNRIKQREESLKISDAVVMVTISQ
jgi:putative DNA methylase